MFLTQDFEECKDFIDKMISPTTFHLVVQLTTMSQTTSSGLSLSDQLTDPTRYKPCFGRIISMGPDCFSDEKIFKTKSQIKIGDAIWFDGVCLNRRVVQMDEKRSILVGFINDDQVLSTINNDILLKETCWISSKQEFKRVFSS